MRVGRAVKARRERMGWSLRALALKSGVSSSMISDIERGTKSPTVSTLAMLAKALGVGTAMLIDAEPSACARIHVVRRAERQASVDKKSGALRENVGAPQAGSNVEFVRYVVPPRKTAGPFPAHARRTIEHVHVAAGAVRVVVGEESVALETGDSCSAVADAPHLFDNTDGKGEALLYLVIERR